MIDWKFSEVGIVMGQKNRQNFLWIWTTALCENLSVIGTIEAEFHKKYQEIEKLEKEKDQLKAQHLWEKKNKKK